MKEKALYIWRRICTWLTAAPTRKVLKAAGNVAFVLVLVLVFTMAAFLVKGRLDGGEPTLAGYHSYIVVSGSMEPEFGAGSVVLVKPVDSESLAVGDIITYRAGDSLVTHRIVDRGESGFVTRGDANNVNDPGEVAPEQVVGRVVLAIPRLGYLLNFSQTRLGLLLLIVLPCLLVIGFEVRNIICYGAELEKQKQRNAGGGRVE